ncbi:MAG: thymidine phosphorylase [Bacilli bacterium]|nr:thymidine phosphorylase [Bacilli bacterium]
MNIVDLINKKRIGLILSDEEIKFIIEEYMNGTIFDYQMSSLLMAICTKGMTENEIISLTKYMTDSGEKLDLSELGDNVVDKHSTGGVGDKTTIITGPIVAACGVKVAKMSGRGLGHTGGTIDKLESIPNFNSSLSVKSFIKQVKEVGFVDSCQNDKLAPADKKIYALRDVTGTVESPALIASSIMSKKIASGAKKIIIDVKVGRGALLKTIQDAEKLSNLMIKIGKKNKVEVVCILTNMDVPLGNNIGNSLEIEEAIDVLKNNKNGSLRDLCVELSTYMVSMGLDIDYDSAKEKVLNAIESGMAYEKFKEFVKAQNGDLDNLPKATKKYDIKSPKEGYLNNIDALELGKLSMQLGAGRLSIDDKIDYTAGIVVHKNVGDLVKRGDILMTLYTKKVPKASIMNTPIFEINKTKKKKGELIYKIIK